MDEESKPETELEELSPPQTGSRYFRLRVAAYILLEHVQHRPGEDLPRDEFRRRLMQYFPDLEQQVVAPGPRRSTRRRRGSSVGSAAGQLVREVLQQLEAAGAATRYGDLVRILDLLVLTAMRGPDEDEPRPRHATRQEGQELADPAGRAARAAGLTRMVRDGEADGLYDLPLGVPFERLPVDGS